jgi:predicted GNAT family N-acyltransferase
MSINPQLFSVRLISWQAGESRLHAVREAVFIREQHVPIELEWDGRDAACRHVLATSAAGEAIGCGRITPDAHIGRMAVLQAWRGLGVGSAILQTLLDYARSQKYPQVELSAQVQAVPFYRRFGFAEEGDVYQDAGMPHITMRLPLPARNMAAA